MAPTRDRPVRVALAGAGPWAREMHAPTLAAGPETVLSGVWARRPDAAAELAGEFDVPAAGSFDELLAGCEAVAFAVPPDVQSGLAIRAARAGKALLLEKPVALELDEARAVADEIDAAGVVSQLVLSKRYHPVTREFLGAARDFEVSGARSCYLHGAFLGGQFATPWRLRHGVLFDLGPHLLDLLEAAVGRIESVRADGNERGWVELTCRHETGATSQASLSGHVGGGGARTVVELFGGTGMLRYDAGELDHAACWPVLRAEFAAAVRCGTAHPLDVRHGVRLQELLTLACASLGRALP